MDLNRYLGKILNVVKNLVGSHGKTLRFPQDDNAFGINFHINHHAGAPAQKMMKHVASDAYIRPYTTVLQVPQFDVGIERYDWTAGVSY